MQSKAMADKREVWLQVASASSSARQYASSMPEVVAWARWLDLLLCADTEEMWTAAFSTRTYSHDCFELDLKMDIEVDNDSKGDSDDKDEDDGIEVDEDEALEEGFGGTEADTQEAVHYAASSLGNCQ